MKDPTGTKHREKHAKELGLNRRVTFSENVRENFGTLYELVKKSRFEGENMLNLKEFASFPETNLLHLLTALPELALAVEQHVAETGNDDAHYAFKRVLKAIDKEGAVVIPPQKSTRGI